MQGITRSFCLEQFLSQSSFYLSFYQSAASATPSPPSQGPGNFSSFLGHLQGWTPQTLQGWTPQPSQGWTPQPSQGTPTLSGHPNLPGQPCQALSSFPWGNSWILAHTPSPIPWQMIPLQPKEGEIQTSARAPSCQGVNWNELTTPKDTLWLFHWAAAVPLRE